MRVDQLDALAQQNKAQHRQERKKVGQRVLARDDAVRHIVHLHAPGQVAHATAVRSIRVRDDNDLA